MFEESTSTDHTALSGAGVVQPHTAVRACRQQGPGTACLKVYRGLQGCTKVYRGLPRFAGVYRGLQGCTEVYRGVPRFTEVNQGLQR